MTTLAAGDLSYRTVMTRTLDNVGVAEVVWESNGGLGDMGTGGEWLPNDTFLIRYSADKGPLVLHPSGVVTAVAQELFGITHDPATLVDMLVTPVAHDGGYRLLLTGHGSSAMVFHPDADIVETLPSGEFWYPPTSPDGRWLVLPAAADAGGPGSGLRIRLADDIGGAFQPLPSVLSIRDDEGGDQPAAGSYMGERDWSLASPAPDWKRFAFRAETANDIAIVSFPDGEVESRWRIAPYRLGSFHWSKDGESLIVLSEGGSGVSGRALFLISLPSK